MKKIISVILTLIVLLSCVSGCNAQIESDKLSIVATIFPQYDFARAISGGLADVKMLLTPGAEAHSYEPTPRDIMAIESCDIFIYTGGESDKWLDDILDSIDTSNIQIIALTDIVAPIKEDDVHGGEHSYDEHVWTSPQNAAKITEVITEAMCNADLDNAEVYTANSDRYIAELEDIDDAFETVIAEASKNTVVFADRFPLLHFVKQYGLEYKAAYPGCESNTEPSPAVIAELINYVNSEGISVIFKIELSNGNIAETVGEATGANIITFYTCHNIPKVDFESGKTYIDFMRENINSLKEALR